MTLIATLRRHAAAKPRAWRKRTFAIRTRDGRENVSGWALGTLAYHPQSGGTGWAVVNIPTGLAFSTSIKNKKLARETANWIATNVPGIEQAKAGDQIKRLVDQGPGMRTLQKALERLKTRSLKPKKPKPDRLPKQEHKEFFETFPFEDWKQRADVYWQEAKDRGLVATNVLTGKPSIRQHESGKDTKGDDRWDSGEALGHAVRDINLLIRLVTKINKAQLFTDEARKWFDKDSKDVDKSTKVADKYVKAPNKGV